MQQTEQQQPQGPPAEFWKIGRLRPIKFTFLSEYPYAEKGIYAIYLNEQTKEPERVYIPQIAARQLDYNLIYQDCLKVAMFALKIMLEDMKKKGIEIPKVTDEIYLEAFGKEIPPA